MLVEDGNLLRTQSVSSGVSSVSTAVLIPCCNEELTIGDVVRDMRATLPTARIYVYDNNSSDATIAAAESGGAIVRKVLRQGKGNVVRRMFADIEADFYVLIDGDGTYDCEAAGAMIHSALKNHHDMIIGTRVHLSRSAYRKGHVLGNRCLTWLVSKIFNHKQRDMLSGYRVLTRRFVKSFPALSTGFEIESELTIHALRLDMSIGEVETMYVGRPAGSESKLETWRDGWRILRKIFALVLTERPLLCFGLVGLLCALAGIGAGAPSVIDFVVSHKVSHLPSGVLATGLELVAVLALVCGILLNTAALTRLEARRLVYLEYPAPWL